MKRIKKHIQKIKKIDIKKGATTLVLLFFAMTMVFQKDAPNTELQFIRNNAESFDHGAPNTQRDYLFEDEWGQDVYQWQMNTGESTTIPDNTDTIDSLINPDEIWAVIGTTSWQLYSWTMMTWTIMSWTQAQQTGTMIKWSLDCITPWGEDVKHKDFVIAYEQRKDVNTICNVEKRVCMSWTLEWSFLQDSCKDDVVYEYQRAQVISYNQKVLNEYIQPTAPVNSWAEFNTEGKIDDIQQPIDSRWTSSNAVTSDPAKDQTEINKKNCTTPRWQKVLHGQFIKAYKAPRGFIDLPCDVQIRACVNGTMKGSFTYSKCTFNNTTYADYLTAGSPTSNTWFLFFEWIKSTLRRLR